MRIQNQATVPGLQSTPVQSTMDNDSIAWCLPGFVCTVIFSCCLNEEAPESHPL